MQSLEIWRVIPGWGAYEVSNLGRVRSIARLVGHRFGIALKRSVTLRPAMDSVGYMTVALSKDSKPRTHRVHRLVAIAFLGEQSGLDVNHIDSDRKNNSLENLEWVTRAGNMAHAKAKGRLKRGAPRDWGRYANP